MPLLVINSTYLFYFVVAIILFLFIIFWGVYANPINSENRKHFRSCTTKIIATITENKYEHGYSADANPKNSALLNKIRKVDYEFFVSDHRYIGTGKVKFSNSSNQTTIYYNPDNPKNNCTKYDRDTAYGISLLKGYLIAFVVIILCAMFLKHKS